MRLKDVLNKYASGKPDAVKREIPLGPGSGEIEPSAADPEDKPTIDRDALKNDLEKVRINNNMYFLLCVVMIVVLFIISLAVTLANLSQPDVIKIVMSAFGISAAGLIWIMIRLWREKSHTEYLLAFAAQMDANTISKVIDLLARSFSGKQSV